MKKALGIVLLVLAISLVSVPAFAEQARLNLKLWYPSVVGVDEWVADYGTYDLEEWFVPTGVSILTEESEYPPHKDENTLILQPGSGVSFILSGEYFILPSISVGGSYWGLSRVNEVGVELESDVSMPVTIATMASEYPEIYWIEVPWWESELPIWWSKTILEGEETLSMSALDMYATKTLSGPGWEASLSGGVRRTAFNERLSTQLELAGEYEGEWEGYYYWEGWKDSFDLDSKLNVSAIGPQIGIEGTYAFADKLVLKAGAKAALLFGTAQTDAIWTVKYWDYYYEEEMNGVGLHVASAQAEENPYEWELYDSGETVHKATDAVRVTTYDLSAALAYQITEQWSVEAGYYASIWKGVPSPYFFSYNVPWYEIEDDIYGIDSEDAAWEQREARDIVVRGLTLGVNFKF